MIIYYAHSKLDYNTAFEQESIRKIAIQFPGATIIDPNKDMGELESITPYLQRIDQSNTIIVTEHKGYVGKGVYVEVKYALKMEKSPILLRNEKFIPIKSVRLVDPFDWKFRYGSIITT